MEANWAKNTGIAFGALLAAGTAIAMVITLFQCEKVDAAASLWEGAVFASLPSVVPALARQVPRAVQPFINVLRDTFGVAPEKAPLLGQAQVMMLLAWITGSRLVTNITKAVCLPTPDEVAEFKKSFQTKQAQKDADDVKRAEISQTTK